MTPSDASLTKLLRKGWRGDTASDLMAEAADRIEALVKERDALVEQLKTADRQFTRLKESSGKADAQAVELAAVLEKVREIATMGTQYVDDPVDGERIIMLDPKLVLDAISAYTRGTDRD